MTASPPLRFDATRRLPRWLAAWLVVVLFGAGVLGAAHGVLHGCVGHDDGRALAHAATHAGNAVVATVDDAFNHSAGDAWCGVFDALCHGGPLPAQAQALAPCIAKALALELTSAAPALRVWWHTPARGPPARAPTSWG